MSAREPQSGNDYLTPSGLPVRVAGIGQGDMVLQSLASDNLMRVPISYPLERLRSQRAVAALRPRPYRPRGPKLRKGAGIPKPLAPIIDAMLLAGDMTMRGILRELRRRASTECRGRDLEANVRARRYWLRKRGHRCISLARS
ncbi:MAG: hypothetical protein AUJ52_11140 [Elusimicrobia bacterium CG1_02_63_36]|nr:MAG: hypothetical protein AUJ52_11140 [Elusimicrobia bacterium CG1_02_63_36]PIP83249.1 MAG: hypothetical protein COR54_10605 [Elusimicrobia bacterium CG22_combo_CG10-13_8_21_14_all_63_91]PJA14137.1 MAG: hypothetical protein COX66_13045 [Elusimicrobia bacterium CG_4_10_14_0_2_um_filter_63_34]PJB24758.1 MAG: hypothetical protein CO113_12255 [Elusimicrobia bacterium CG_4_9_14_3_um_filter_62_55]